MPAIHLNKTHPILFQAIFAIALTHLSVGGLMLHAVASLGARNPVLAAFFITAFFVIGLMMLYGLLRPSYDWVRRGLTVGLLLIGFLSIAFVLSVGRTLNEEQTTRLAWIIPPWLWWAASHLLGLMEPPSNPVSGVKE